MPKRWTTVFLAIVVVTASVAPAVDADGPYTIAFASFSPLNSEIVIADAEGHHPRVVVAGAAHDVNPACSRTDDGRLRLAAARIGRSLSGPGRRHRAGAAQQ